MKKILFFFFCSSSLFTLDKSQCDDADLQQQIPLTDPYSEQPGIVLKGDNLARMLALCSGETMQNVERLADNMIMYGLIRFGMFSLFRTIYYSFLFFFFFFKDKCEQKTECCCFCCCVNKFHNDNNYQYILSNSHRLVPDKRLDLSALMQYDASFVQPFNDILSYSCVNVFNCKFKIKSSQNKTK